MKYIFINLNLVLSHFYYANHRTINLFINNTGKENICNKQYLSVIKFECYLYLFIYKQNKTIPNYIKYNLNNNNVRLNKKDKGIQKISLMYF